MSKVDRLYYNGSVYSVDDKSSKYEAIGITGNKISFLGSVDEGMKLEAAERIDLKGKVVLPGFIDSHLHLLNYAFVNQSFKMFACDSIEGIKEEAKEIIKTFNEKSSLYTICCTHSYHGNSHIRGKQLWYRVHT